MKINKYVVILAGIVALVSVCAFAIQQSQPTEFQRKMGNLPGALVQAFTLYTVTHAFTLHK